MKDSSRKSIQKLTLVTEFRFKLYPKDFYKVKDFYENVLSYQIVDSWDSENDKGVMFNTGDAILELLTPKDGYKPVQGAGLSLMVKDVWTLWEKLKDHPNIIKPLSLHPSSWGDVGFRIADPEGFQITFFTPDKLKPRK